MTLAHFSGLSSAIQLAAVRTHGRSLVKRRAGQSVVNLYVMPLGFFVAVTFDAAAGCVAGLRAMPSTDRLEDYADAVQLPEWITTDNVAR